MNHPRRVIPLQGGVNFRDLGGYLGTAGRPIRWGLVFRSGTTHRLDDADRARLGDLNIRSVIDLRSNRERGDFPHGLVERHDVTYWARDHEHISGNLHRMLTDDTVNAAQMDAAMRALYGAVPYEFSAALQRLFATLIAGPLPLVFNCAAGKDRTGVAAALLLSALGVAWEDIVEDYLLTEHAISEVMQIFGWSDVRGPSARYDAEVLARLIGVDRLYLEAMRDAIIERSGSIDDYLRSELAMDGAALRTLRDRLLG